MIKNHWRELGPALFLATLLVILIQAAGSALTIYVLWHAWNTRPGPDVAFMTLIFTIANILPFLVWAKPGPKPAIIPNHALDVGPNSYMKVWAADEKIHFVFRNMPIAKISFDKRAAKPLADVLGRL